MHVKARSIALSAMMLALSVVFLYFTQFLPTMRLALAGAACLCMTVLTAETGPYYALIAFAAGSFLCLLLVPTFGWLFVGFFGWYPIAKCFLERVRSKPRIWVLKVACFLAAFVLAYLAGSALLGALFPRFAAMPVLLLAAGLIAFVLFDLVLTKFINWYLFYIRPKLGMNRG